MENELDDNLQQETEKKSKYEQFLDTMISHNPKIIALKFELLKYNEDTDSFELYDEQVVKNRQMPDGVSSIMGNIDINIEQDVRTTLDLAIVNDESLNNWGSDSDLSDDEQFKWWLDKRLNIDMGLRLDGSDEIEFVRMGHFVITHFKSNHNLTAFPVTEIQGSSKEVLYSSRRGKFLFPTTIKKGAVMTDTVRAIISRKEDELLRDLTGGFEVDKDIMIDPGISKTSLKMEDGEDLDGWTTLVDSVSMELDEIDKAHGDSSIKFTVSESLPEYTVIAEKEWRFPVDLSSISAMALWTRCSTDVPENGLSIILVDESGVERELPLRQLVGHIVDGEQILFDDNWRNVILPVEDFKELTAIKKMQLCVNNTQINTPFDFWIDQVYCAEMRNMLPHELHYGAGENKWEAIKELANLLDSDVYFDEWGKFILKKRKFPREKIDNFDPDVEEETFDYDAYDVLQPVITYRDTQERNNLYAGGDSLFEEHELSNHTHVIGGSTTHRVLSIADMIVHSDGLYIREKGKLLNTRGQVRAIDQFHPTSSPTILNGDTNVEEVYKGHQNLEAVMNAYPDGFPELAKPPVSNFAVEKIGDFIYHHNNANPDPIIVYAYEAKNRALWELRKRLAYSEQLNIMSAPYYILRGGDIIRIEDSLLDVNDDFEIKSMSIPLNGDYMSISAIRVDNLIVDVPFFDISPVKANASWYFYDGLSLAFTHEL